MRILRIVSSGYEQGGVENALVITNDILRSHGHEVETISSNARPDMPHYSDHEFQELPKGGVGKIIRTTFNMDAYKLAKKVARTFQPDIVTLHTLHQPSASVLYALKDYRLVICVHGPEGYTKWLLPWGLTVSDYKTRPYDLSDLSLIGKLHFSYFRYLIRPLYMQRVKKIPHVISYSNYTQAMMRNEGIESIYIPEGVTPLPVKHKSTPTKKVGFAGRLEKHKGVDYMIDAVAVAAKRDPEIQFVIAGDGSYKDALVEQVDALGLKDVVTFAGHLSRDDIKKFYSDIDLFLMASSPAETFGKVGVEAMSTGTPVLAPDIGGIGDWLRDGKNGYFIPMNDAARYAEKIVSLLNDPEMLSKLGMHAAATAREFTLEQYAQMHEDYFKKIIND